MSQETIHFETEAIPLKERNAFQRTLFKLMLGAGLENKPQSEKADIEVALVERYGKIVSDMIDDPTHLEIRRLIMEQKYDEASALLIKTLSDEQIAA